jgi:hypothetical protein
MRPLFAPSIVIAAIILGWLGLAESVSADEAKENTPVAAEPGKPGEASGSSTAGMSSSPQPPHAALLKDAKSIGGLIPLYQKGNQLYAELSSSHYNSEFIVLISIARGIGRGSLLGGMSWGFGDDWIWTFRKVDDNVHIVRKNVRFRAAKNSPEASAVRNAYTDSVLFSVPANVKGPNGGDLVDLTQVFMSDLPQISMVLPGFSFSANKSSWAAVKGFHDNVELEVAAVYASGGAIDFDSVPDSRGVTLNVHYSISKLPQAGYQPRLADDRVGYFLTVVKDFSQQGTRDAFVRYINRWDLQKADPAASLSPPKTPIVFWIEKTVPFKFRKPIREGIEEWNRAFEKAGFVNAIEVRQQPDNADWDPEDINYNTFRWITAGAGFAMGPSRVNPYTGQILDADIIFDADFLQFWKNEFETFTPETVAAMTFGSLDPEAYRRANERSFYRDGLLRDCHLSQGMASQLALGSLALAAAADPKDLEERREKLITQGLKEVTMHEVGHTLGLRHNFKASTFLKLSDMADPEKTKATGLVASVMDYSPAHIVPKDATQGDFFTTTVGPYDVWAIQYGYTPFSGGTQGEVSELKKIAARSGEPGLAYATDEDTRGIDPDPHSNRFDLGDDPIEYAKLRAKLVQELIPDLVERTIKEGDDYTQARRAFNILLATHGQSMYFASRYVGGLETTRSHKGDKGAGPPITVIDPKKQRAALELLEEQIFSEKPYDFPPELYNHLGASRWLHWGTQPPLRPDFPVHQFIGLWQEMVLQQLLSSVTLERIHDAELKVPADQDAFTAAELLQRVTKAVFSEVDDMKDGEYSTRQPAISSLRRNLQRSYLQRLSLLAMGRTGAPHDCATLAYSELQSLADRIDKLLKKKIKLDSYSRAHLEESSSRIRKVLDARFILSSP